MIFVMLTTLCSGLLRKVKIVLQPFNRLQTVRYSKYNMNSISNNKIYVRHENGSDQFQATFVWSYKALNINREFNFNRRLKEKLEDFLGRIKINVEKAVHKKAKRKRKSTVEENFEDEVYVKMFNETTEIPTDLSCEDVFFSDIYDPEKLRLKVMDESYRILVNSPWILKMILPSSIMAGFPIYPSIDIKFGHQHNSDYIWYRKSIDKNEWIEVGHNLVYTPSTEEIGHKLKLSCVPGNGQLHGPEITVEANVNVEAGPGLCPFHSRHIFTKENLPIEKFRVISYNILADLYAETDVAKNELFPYCPPYAISLDYRKQLYLQEILGYNGDIICLQEVDCKVFENDLLDVLGQKNLSGVLTRKGGNVSEGVATFYSTEKFRLLETRKSEMGEEIDIDPIYHDIWIKIKDNENLRERFKDRNTVLQVLILESVWNPKEKIIVGNTHLFFHPDADHIRLLQAGMILRYLEDIIKYFKLKHPTNKISLIMCGDFNSTPDSGIYRLMTTNNVPNDIVDWSSKEGEEVKGLELTHPFLIESAYGTPLYTNYTVGFAGCLDYIYYQKDKLNVVQVVPLPDEDTLKANTAIPSITFPSDHVALVADFEWKVT